MKENLLSAIKAHDFTAIRNICFALSEEERQELKSYFARKNFNFIFREVLEKEKRYHFSNKELAIISYTIMCVCNTLEEVRKIELFQNIEPYIKGNYYYFLSSLEDEVLLDFVQSPQGAYMIEGIQLMCKDNPLEMSFQILWSVYNAGYIPLNEGVFIQRMYDINWLKADEQLTEYLLKHPETVVLFPSVPTYIQDTIFTTEEWKKIYHTLNEKAYFTNKNAIIRAFIEALLNPWKKTVLDMYCRWIETLDPSHQELLANQHTLFALLSSDKISVVNFAMKLIKQIADEKSFDFQAFADNFALCFATQKIAKSQLIGLDILEKYYKKQVPTNPDYREQLAVLFTVPDVKLQEKVASLLTTYFGREGLVEVVVPYQDYLKGDAQNLLTTLSLSENTESSESFHTSSVDCLSEIRVLEQPSSWDELLFLLGDCLRERTAATIDLFFEGVVQLQDQLPENFKEQLAPYIAQVNGMYYFNLQLAALQLLLAGWVEDRPLESPEDWKKMNTQVRRLNTEEEEPLKQACVLHNVWYLRDEIPYLLYKVTATLDKLKTSSKLPFLSTPTHAPFYIDAETLADRLLAYQTAGKEVDLDDLVVACNRLLLSTITPKAQEKVRTLSGQYVPALGYLFGLSDVVTPTEEFLPLWTQITRLKHPNKVFAEFEATPAKDYLSAVKPFFLSYEIDSENKWFYLEKKYINSPYNDYQCRNFEKEEDRLPYNYYNAGAFQTFDVDTLRYAISLNPQYVDVLLGKYTPPWVGVSDAETYRNLQVPLQLLLEYDLPVHHGGWIFVGMALLHDKKETRDLGAEYILRAISRDEDLSYLQHFIADILAQKLTPINRFVEFLDMPTRDPKIKAFQKGVVEEYLRLVENVEKKPTNHKKLAGLAL
ncbi:DUF6493 family protein [Capnocytophaga sp. oral taxon 878]|uniref:DUF6493 family protein n=1 Tax=Capnocytophaga sp. oral taxon 878 TaxID=1316596 RepID=UPI000D0469C6|nr:DUF6493 family protein [Capnocytophaga sp. oral taxon 878]AVM51384.1 hypothetical protein C4H12_13435 [Capnocytophaga sp. oral taxon 878]